MTPAERTQALEVAARLELHAACSAEASPYLEREAAGLLRRFADEAGPPYYIGGPYHDGGYAMCETSTGRVVHREPPNVGIEPVTPATEE